jgi:DNA-binding NarL/FixJ family response regulator
MPPTRAEPDTARAVVTVVVVDDRPIVRAGILHALSDAAAVHDEHIEAEEGELAEAGLLVDKHQPQAVVVVLRGDDPEPYRTIATAKGLRENVHVLALVDEVTGPDLREAVIAGADGFLVLSPPRAPDPRQHLPVQDS